MRCVAFSRFFSVPNGSSYILTCFLSCHLDRGGKGISPISYKDLTTLHLNCVRALAMSSFNPPARNVDLDTGTYTKYCKFQVQWTGRINHLKTPGLQFEIPDKDDADKCMPPMLAKFDAKIKADAPQPPQNYEKGKSCAFDPARIAAYEQASRTFKDDVLKIGQESLPKLRDLLVMDIACIHARNIKWKTKQPAHLGGNGARSDDDDPAVDNAAGKTKDSAETTNESADAVILQDDCDFTKWDFMTACYDIPWRNLSHSLTGGNDLEDAPLYFPPAMCIAYHSISIGIRNNTPVPLELSLFYERCEIAIEKFTASTVESFLDLPNDDNSQAPTTPDKMWKSMTRKTRTFYKQDEVDYITEVWKLARDAYLHKTQAGSPAPKEPSHDETADAPRQLRSHSHSDASKEAAPAAEVAAEPEPARRYRQKQQATFRTQPSAAPKRHIGTRDSAAAGQPAVTPIIRKGRPPIRKRSAEEQQAESSIPKSLQTNRVLLGQVSLNKRFPKSFISANPSKEPPVSNLTLGKAWHVVRAERVAADGKGRGVGRRAGTGRGRGGEEDRAAGQRDR